MALKTKFVESCRLQTLSRFEARRSLNERRCKTTTCIPLEPVLHRRQDVCSGLTSPIGGDIRDFPKKGILRLLTPSIAHMDKDATRRLEKVLVAERREEESELAIRSRTRNEIRSEVENRHRYLNLLEQLSGIQRCSSASRSQTVSLPERIDKLARPKLRHYANLENCLDGVNLIHVTTPQILTL